MKCSMCGREMAAPKVRLGRMALGPKCAQKAGLYVPKRRETPIFEAYRVHRDTSTRDMFEVTA